MPNTNKKVDGEGSKFVKRILKKKKKISYIGQLKKKPKKVH